MRRAVGRRRRRATRASSAPRVRVAVADLVDAGVIGDPVGAAGLPKGQPPTLSVPVMFGWTVHMNGYVPAASAGTSYFATVTPVTTSPLNTWAPEASLISTLCGVPASPFRNSIVNGASAGA